MQLISYIRIYLFILIGIIFFNFKTVNYVQANRYSIIPLDSSKVIECKKFKTNKNEVICSDINSNIVWRYNLNSVKIYYKGIEIYPYNWNVDKAYNALVSGKCTEIVKEIFGAYYIDRTIDSFYFAGYLNEKGLCIQKDINTSIFLYEHFLSHYPSKTSLRDRINVLKVKSSDYNYQIITKSQKVAECRIITPSKNKIICSNKHEYLLTDIKYVFYKQTKIFPYSDNWLQQVEKNLDSQECEKLYANLYGPLFVDNLNLSYFPYAQMNDKGLCIDEDNTKALSYYKHAMHTDPDRIVPMIKAVEKEIEDGKELELALMNRGDLKLSACSESCRYSGFYKDSCYNSCVRERWSDKDILKLYRKLKKKEDNYKRIQGE